MTTVYVLAYLTFNQVSGWIVMAAATLGALVYLVRGMAQLVRQGDKLNDLPQKVDALGTLVASIKDQMDEQDRRSDAHTVQLNAAEDHLDSIETRLASIEQRLDDGSVRFDRLESVTARLEKVAREYHPGSLDDPADTED